MPAQLTKTLIGPSSFSTSSIAALTAFSSVASNCQPFASAPDASLTNEMVSEVSRKSNAAIVAPTLAKLRQIPCPIPRADPLN
jgi:hypothetical protein